VHTFASDPARGVFILMILVFFIGGGLTLFAWRGPMLKQGGLFAPVSREGALVFNNLFLTTACLTVFVGTLYPLALEALTDEKISVGAPFFNLTFAPLFIPLLFAMPFGPMLAWKRGDVLGVSQRLMAAFGAGLVAIIVTFVVMGVSSALAPLGIGLALFVMVGALVDLAERTSLFRAPLSTVRSRAAGLPRSAWGTAIAHFGIAVTLFGIVCQTWASERIVALKPSQVVSLADYDLTFDGMVQHSGPNFRELAAKFTVRSGGVPIGTMEPSKRSFASRNSTTTEAALMTRGVSQLYLSLGDTNDDGSIAIRLYHKPMVLLIWIGALVMMLGGALSLSDRRLRIGAPKPAPKAPAAILEAAE
jgi:cytochrome c-type biogenesis protein CcmF